MHITIFFLIMKRQAYLFSNMLFNLDIHKPICHLSLEINYYPDQHFQAYSPNRYIV